MAQTNFLIGRGELLTAPIAPILKKMDPKPPFYSLEEAREQLLPQFETASKEIDNLSSDACPGDFGIIRMILNPGFVAKSYYPGTFFNETSLTPVGSKNVSIADKKASSKSEASMKLTTELYVAGKRSSLRRMKQVVSEFEPNSKAAAQFGQFEEVSKFTVFNNVMESKKRNEYYEATLHLLPDENAYYVQSAFMKFAQKLGFEIFDKLSFQVGTLWFVPLYGARASLKQLSDFVFLRIIRNIPRLRGIRPFQRAANVSLGCQLPTETPISSQPRVAILDGGLPSEHPLDAWLNSYRKLDENAADIPDGVEHGLGVTSAFLFGPITPSGNASRPFSFVNHLRVLDRQTNNDDPLELYRTLGLIEEVLLSRQYEFINLSLGPDLPIEDGEIHPWTALIDSLLSNGETFMTVAAGNNGEHDRESGNARVQIPADCVNAMAVGAASEMTEQWVRAPYSAIGPGRRPGFIKPDVLSFGGTPSSYFHVLSMGKKATVAPELGTSFSAPYLLRTAVGIRAILGEELSPLAIKALLIHSAQSSAYDCREVGWGKTPDDLMSIITCAPGVARIVYQGFLTPGKFIKAQIPIPNGGLSGNCKIRATFCYASPVDPQDANAYTRAALEITFRPNSAKKKQQSAKVADSKSFFTSNMYATEEERRTGLNKWETVLHAEKSMRGSSLQNSSFDIHYIAREAGAPTRSAEKIPYALILSIEAPKHANLFSDILQSYSALLPIQPQVSLPIRL